MALLGLAGLLPAITCPAERAASASEGVHAVRLSGNPIIRAEMLPGNDGANINGPSLLRAPAWLADPLGKYYLYFAHHGGKYVRLAYADKLEGSWKIHRPGTLHVSEAPGCTGHIASPDVHLYDQRKEIPMYFHGPAKTARGQKSFVALSKDGINFKAGTEPLGFFYFRVFRWDDAWLAMAKGGLLYQDYNRPGVRHVALHRVGDVLWVYYSNIGDAPERILRCKIELAKDWNDWKPSAAEEVLRPEEDYEGADLPLKKSSSGAAKGPENALRAPCIFVDDDRRVYLLYSVAGESGIGIAELK